MRRASVATLMLLALACSEPTREPRAIVFVNEAEASAGSFQLDGEIRRALAADLLRRFEFTVTLPEAPLLGFAIGALGKDRPTLLAPVRFRVLVDPGGAETEVFAEIVRRSQGERWFPRSVDLAPWSGKSVRLVFEALPGGGGVEGGEKHILALWGNPILKSARAAPDKPTVVLVSIDCLRADHVGSYGYPRDTTPNLDGFAREAVVFRNAVASSSYTLPTHASMLTGLPPSLHGATKHRIRGTVEYLPELLTLDGYQAVGVVSAPFLAAAYGFDRGFHAYRLSSGRAAHLVDRALALLEEGEGLNRFLFLHLFDVHWPYSPPAEFLDRFGPRPKDITDLLARTVKGAPRPSEGEINQLRSLYDAEIAYVDSQLGRLFAELQKRGLYDSSLIVITADHGEAFFEHGSWEHARPWQNNGPGLDQEIVHVPLIVKWPGRNEGTVVDTVVSQTDIFPTVLQAAGLARDGAWAKSLRQGGSARALSEFLASPKNGGLSLEVALREGAMKYRAFFRGASMEELYSSEPHAEELYDLDSDPAESRDLLRSRNDALDEYRRTVRSYLSEALETWRESSEEVATPDPELVEQLKSLGYIER